MYAWLGLGLYWLLWLPIYLFSRLRPDERVRIVVINRRGQILLVKTWLSRQSWTLPGGGIAGNETPEQAALRELREEAGIVVAPEDLSYLGVIKAGLPLSCDLRVYRLIFDGQDIPKLAIPYRWEIIDRCWASPDLLPPATSRLVRQALHGKFEKN